MQKGCFNAAKIKIKTIQKKDICPNYDKIYT